MYATLAGENTCPLRNSDKQKRRRLKHLPYSAALSISTLCCFVPDHYLYIAEEIRDRL